MNILITGGASGLGSSITKRLAENKNNFVYFTYSKSAEKANAINSLYANTAAIKCDFTSNNEVLSLLQKIESLDIDVLINNAISSKITMKHFDKLDVEYFRTSFNSNILPTIQIAQKCLSLFKKKKSGKIISILTSFLANRPPTGCAEYVASKAYLESLSKSWASEYIKYNISSNCVSPSFMQTDFTSDTDERLIDEQITNHPLKRLLTTDEVAESVEYLANCSTQINGINLIINAGSNII